MVINFVEIVQDFYPKIINVGIVETNSVVLFTRMAFDKKAVSHEGCVVDSSGLYGMLPLICLT